MIMCVETRAAGLPRVPNLTNGSGLQHHIDESPQHPNRTNARIDTCRESQVTSCPLATAAPTAPIFPSTYLPTFWWSGYHQQPPNSVNYRKVFIPVANARWSSTTFFPSTVCHSLSPSHLIKGTYSIITSSRGWELDDQVNRKQYSCYSL
ncbi:uncharacterized protein LOC108738155 [Agrilus planipennis]|uniref:Uncharacterized protein LOC108738155 n=1 Tax=Agrilus planipennis TaxID=224129 RepID=A0A1W4WSP7_AGRPL|nr:uncharacterized protein LOC108738155 [Agrilus planipennis]